MTLTNKQQKGIKIGVVVFGVFVVITLIILVIKKFSGDGDNGGGGDSTIDVIVNLKGPKHNLKNKTTISITDFKGKPFGPWFFDSLGHISYPITDVAWNTIKINGTIDIPLTDQEIPQSTLDEKIFKIFDSKVPKNIIIDAVFSHTCAKGNKPNCKEDCTGNGPKCTPEGWECVPGRVCPSDDVLKTCCEASGSAGPYATCGSDTKFKTVCGVCPGDKPDCSKGKPCDSSGALCTSTGWVCADGQVCPPQNEMDKCCTKPGEHATCIDGTVVCSKCKGGVTKCDQDCDMNGIVCGDDGKFQCAKGTTCPTSQKTLSSCCTDPDKPLGFCGADSTKVECKSCGDKPSDDDCPQSCDGNGWKCTSTGWVCAPGIQCPDSDYAEKNCCKGTINMHPVCDPDSNCITCACDSNHTSCGSQSCSSKMSQCDKTCCPNDIPCGKDSLSGECLCCPADKICDDGSGPKCCPGDTICDKNTKNKCVAVCGTLSTGENHTCSEDELCMIITDVKDSVKKKLKKKYNDKVIIDNDNDTAYICTPDTTCTFDGNEVAAPPAIIDYYPCYNYPISDPPDPNHPGVGYCVEKDLTTGDNDCYKHKDTVSCGKDSKKCIWRDVLEYATANSGSGGDREALVQIQKEMGHIQNNELGNYCDPTDDRSSYSRVIAFQGEKNKCGWQNCWSQISQPGITDIEYNSDTGVCVALQSCNSKAGSGMNSYTINNKTGNHNTVNHASPGDVGNSDFPSCKHAECPYDSTPEKPLIPVNYTCDNSNGQIIISGWHGEGDKGTFKCVYGDVTNLLPEQRFSTEEACLGDACGTCYNDAGDMIDGAHCDPDGKCCTNGFKWDLKTKKCYQVPADSIPSCGRSSCSADKNSCGSTWRAHCHGGGFHECHENCCPDNVDGGGKPDGANFTYCVCDTSDKDKSWKEYGSLIGSHDGGNCISSSAHFGCNPRKGSDKC